MKLGWNNVKYGWERWGILSRGLIEVKSPDTGEIILVQMSLGKIRVICFSSKEICETKNTCIPRFEVSGYLTCDIITQMFLNIMACNVLKGRGTSFHLAEGTIVLYASDCYASGAVQTCLFLICNKQGRLTEFIVRHSSCLIGVYLVSKWIVFIEWRRP